MWDMIVRKEGCKGLWEMWENLLHPYPCELSCALVHFHWVDRRTRVHALTAFELVRPCECES